MVTSLSQANRLKITGSTIRFNPFPHLSMTILTLMGLLFGMFVVQWAPVPKWRLLVGLIAIGMVIAGSDLLAVLDFKRSIGTANTQLWSIVGGAIVGLGIGYFIRCTWLSFSGR